MSEPADACPRLRVLLASHRVMTLASRGAQGPWAAAVFYAEIFDEDRLRLVFVSSPSSRHVAELEADSRAAASIHGDPDDWRAIRGAQIAGRVLPLDGAALPAAQRAYASKFPNIGDPARAPEPIARAFAHVRWFALHVDRAFLTDNAISFGHRAELAFPSAH
ncbi:MAG: pyridoxamine 5'-phosphate oxidase family protein [Burkholderiaceae bacterium]|nr:pyridoxamine 5'-phosphate oxidase family protein [Burkholderiaceae bacterium]